MFNFKEKITLQLLIATFIFILFCLLIDLNKFKSDTLLDGSLLLSKNKKKVYGVLSRVRGIVTNRNSCKWENIGPATRGLHCQASLRITSRVGKDTLVRKNEKIAFYEYFLNGKQKKRGIFSPCFGLIESIDLKHQSGLKIILVCDMNILEEDGVYSFEEGIFKYVYNSKESKGETNVLVTGAHTVIAKLHKYVKTTTCVGSYTYKNRKNIDMKIETHPACSGYLKIILSGTIQTAPKLIIGTSGCKEPHWVYIHKRKTSKVEREIMPEFSPIYPSGIVYPPVPIQYKGMEASSYAVGPTHSSTFPGAVATGPFTISMRQISYLSVAEVVANVEGKTSFTKEYGFVSKSDFGSFQTNDQNTGFMTTHLVPLPCVGFLSSVYIGDVAPGFPIAQVICNLKDLELKIPNRIESEWAPPESKDQDCVYAASSDLVTSLFIQDGAKGALNIEHRFSGSNNVAFAGEVIGTFECETTGGSKKIVKLLSPCTGIVRSNINSLKPGDEVSSGREIFTVGCTMPVDPSKKSEKKVVKKRVIKEISENLSKCIRYSFSGRQITILANCDTYMDLSEKSRKELKVRNGLNIGQFSCIIQDLMVTGTLKASFSGSIIYVVDDNVRCEGGERLLVIEVDDEWLEDLEKTSLVGEFGTVFSTLRDPEQPVSLQMWMDAYSSWKNNDYKYLVPQKTRSLVYDPNMKLSDHLLKPTQLIQAPTAPSPGHIFIEKSYENLPGSMFIQEFNIGEHYYRRVGVTATSSVKVQNINHCIRNQVIGVVGIYVHGQQTEMEVKCPCTGAVTNLLKHYADSNYGVQVQAGQTFIEVKCKKMSLTWMDDPSLVAKHKYIKGGEKKITEIGGLGSPVYILEFNDELTIFSKVTAVVRFSSGLGNIVTEGDVLGFILFNIGNEFMAISTIFAPCTGELTYPHIKSSTMSITPTSVGGLKIFSIRCSRIVKQLTKNYEQLLYNYVASSFIKHGEITTYQALLRTPATCSYSKEILSSSSELLKVNHGQEIIYISTQETNLGLIPVKSPCTGELQNVHHLKANTNTLMNTGTVLFEIRCSKFATSTTEDLPIAPPLNPSDKSLVQIIEKSGYTYYITGYACKVSFINDGVIETVDEKEVVGKVICLVSGQTKQEEIIVRERGVNLFFLTMAANERNVLQGTTVMITKKDTTDITEDVFPEGEHETRLIGKIGEKTKHGYVWTTEQGFPVFVDKEQLYTVSEGKIVGYFVFRSDNSKEDIVSPCDGAVNVPSVSLLNNTIVEPASEILKVYCGQKKVPSVSSQLTPPTQTELTKSGRDPIITRNIMGVLTVSWPTRKGTVQYNNGWNVYSQIILTKGLSIGTFSYLDDVNVLKVHKLILSCNGRIDLETANKVNGKLVNPGETIILKVHCAYLRHVGT
ncbi:protease, partial [Cryptosporidium bovis]|uniref:protease n=1 Tax=Cryptosporidium bovis TaxID=310047 RepID=UPI00351A0C7D